MDEFDKALSEIEPFSTMVRVTTKPWDEVGMSPTTMHVASYVIGRVKQFGDMSKEHRLTMVNFLAKEIGTLLELPMKVTVIKLIDTVMFEIDT